MDELQKSQAPKKPSGMMIFPAFIPANTCFNHNFLLWISPLFFLRLSHPTGSMFFFSRPVSVKPRGQDRDGPGRAWGALALRHHPPDAGEVAGALLPQVLRLDRRSCELRSQNLRYLRSIWEKSARGLGAEGLPLLKRELVWV